MLFCQLDYPQELGTGVGYTIAQFGCALTSVTSLLVNVFGKDTDPLKLNQALIDVNGYAANGGGALDILDWTAISRVYKDITVLFNYHYYNPPEGIGLPADMQLLDDRLQKGYSVIVGVSFNHAPNEPTPTHYVELYRKNDDGTYQCRDPWFRNAIDTNFNLRYAVNGMTPANAILQMVGYDGPLPKLVNADISTKFHPGDEINVFTTIPTGASPETITPTYGMITPTAPARVIDVLQLNGTAFYHIDQTYIGGGTGYADAFLVDLATVEPVQAPTSTVAEVNAQTTVANAAMHLTAPEQPLTEQVATTPDPIVSTGEGETEVVPMPDAEANLSLASQRDKALGELGELKKKYEEHLENYTGIIAAGFTTADDILKALAKKANENTGIKKQLLQVLRRNEAYHTDMAEKEKEDATAIEVGLEFERKYEDLKKDFIEIAKNHKTQPTLKAILTSLDYLKTRLTIVSRELKRQNPPEVAQIAQVAENVQTVEPIAAYLSRIFLFQKGGK